MRATARLVSARYMIESDTRRQKVERGGLFGVDGVFEKITAGFRSEKKLSDDSGYVSLHVNGLSRLI